MRLSNGRVAENLRERKKIFTREVNKEKWKCLLEEEKERKNYIYLKEGNIRKREISSIKEGNKIIIEGKC